MPTTSSDPTATTWARRLGHWVSKSDLVAYMRCPYAFWAIDRGLVAPHDAIDALGEQLIEEGNEFHVDVQSLARPMPAALSLQEACVGDATIFGLPVLRHAGLKLLGAPDGVRAGGGALLPIEIKSRKDVRRTDLLELAFYWILLEPHRTRHDVAPAGRLVLRRDGKPATVDVELAPALFEEVRELIAAVRKTRRNGTKPRICGCTVCRGPLREQVRHATREGKDLTLIWGIGRRYAAALEALGIGDYDELLAADPRDVRAGLGARVSLGQVEQWRRHAESYQLAHPVAFGPPTTAADAFIALDLEYDPMSPHIWLIGAIVSRGDRREHHALWADTPDDLADNLRRLARLFAKHKTLPIITWAGADLPKLASAAASLNVTGIDAPLDARHVDLFLHAASAIRLPIPKLGLGELASYFGAPKLSPISGGLEALLKYKHYRETRDPKRQAALKADLIAYNRDDLEGLIGVHTAIRELHLTSARPTSDRCDGGRRIRSSLQHDSSTDPSM